jgi:hypothetical protein
MNCAKASDQLFTRPYWSAGTPSMSAMTMMGSGCASPAMTSKSLGALVTMSVTSSVMRGRMASITRGTKALLINARSRVC